MDINGNGTLEILTQTFGAGFFIYTVPGSAENQLLWPTARGNFLRDGQPLPASVTPGSGTGVGRTGKALPPIYLLLK